MRKELSFEIGSDLHELSVIADRLPKLLEEKLDQNNNWEEEFDKRFPESDYTFIEHGTKENEITGETEPENRDATKDIKGFIKLLKKGR